MPLISGILPTRGRQDWARQAVHCFLDQIYPEKELIIFDDGDEPSFPRTILATMVCPNQIQSEFHNHVTIEGVSVRYIRSNATVRTSIWDKRNVCCDIAQGQWIAHFDSDDFSHPDRLKEQLKFADSLVIPKAVIGFNTMLFYEPESGRAAKYIGRTTDAVGTSLLYRKDFWLTHPFKKPSTGITGSDNQFVREARAENQLATCEGDGLMVARLHPGRMNANQTLRKIGQEVEATRLPEAFRRAC